MEDLPALTGYNQTLALKTRRAYIRYLNTFAFTEQPISRLDIGLHINLMEEQMHRIFTVSEKREIEDMIYDKYLEFKCSTKLPGAYYIKSKYIYLGLYAIDMFKTTEQWLEIKNRVQCFELMIRCIIYDFKHSKEFKYYLGHILYRPRFYPFNTEY